MPFLKRRRGARPTPPRDTVDSPDRRVGKEAWLALAAALLGWMFDGAEMGVFSLVSRPASLPEGARWKEGGYIDRMPKDPWGNPYNYLQPGTHGEFDLYSLGADGAPGGEGVKADVGGWDLD